MKASHIIVKGKVQGVFFRATTKKQADSLGIKGWVRNLPTGEVEAFLEGEEKNLNEMLLFCKEGPQGSQVDDIEIEEQTPEGLKEFEIL